MFRVIHPFDDLTDYVSVKGGKVYHHYSVGDIYPRNGAKTTEGRVLELMSSNNAQKRPLIESTLLTGDDIQEASEVTPETPSEASETSGEEKPAEVVETLEKANKQPSKKKSGSK